MSTLTADPGFARGQTLGVAAPANTYYGPFNAAGAGVVGTRKTFRDEDPKTGVIYSNATVDCVAVKNTSGGALLPGEVARIKSTALLSEVDAKAVAASVFIGVVDEYLPAAGVPNNEIFWLVVDGPSTVVKTNGVVAAGEAFGPSATAGSAAAVGSNARLGYALESAGANLKSRILVKTVTGY